MVKVNEKLLLVGDNPFHNISHLSQERARNRREDPSDPKYAAALIQMALDNGANGFMFSVSETTLSILKELDERGSLDCLHLCAIVPYAFEYVRLATQLGGIPSLVKRFGWDMLKSRNFAAIGYGLNGVLTGEPAHFLKTYLSYEISRVKSFASRKANVDSLMLHQLITDMTLALDLDWVFKSYVDFLKKRNITPGFNTGNFSFLVNKFVDWGINLENVVIAAPFNKAGFQMTPSMKECEKTLEMLPAPNVIAISILAAGYISPAEAADYIQTLPNIKGVSIGISKEKHAKETFKFFQ
ncbi:hypothetical protein JXA31_06135 [Candidatus Bathyarchaeota archaeon]|nr:hypothetical protein [Candidatus Bathyarchaeota archaeon]